MANDIRHSLILESKSSRPNHYVFEMIYLTNDYLALS